MHTHIHVHTLGYFRMQVSGLAGGTWGGLGTSTVMVGDTGKMDDPQCSQNRGFK